MKKISLFLLSGLMMAASIHAQALSEGKMKKILDEVETAFQDDLSTGENLDAYKLSESVDDDLNAGHIVNGVFFSSFDPILQRVSNGMQGLNSLKYEINDKRITVLSKDAAIVAVSGHTNTESTSGQKFTNAFGWTFVYRKTGGKWKVIHSHQSNPR